MTDPIETAPARSAAGVHGHPGRARPDIGCDRAKGATGRTPPPPPVVVVVVQRTFHHPRLHGAPTDLQSVRAGPWRARQVLFRRAPGQAGPDPVRDPARRVRGSARVGAPSSPRRRPISRGPGHLHRRSRSAGRRPQGRARQGAAGRQPVPPARRGPGDPQQDLDTSLAQRR